MINLMVCDRCGYIGDLSNLPGEPDTSQMSEEEASQLIRAKLPEIRELFFRIGWVRQPNGDDWCPKCVAAA